MPHATLTLLVFLSGRMVGIGEVSAHARGRSGPEGQVIFCLIQGVETPCSLRLEIFPQEVKTPCFLRRKGWRRAGWGRRNAALGLGPWDLL